MRVAEHPTGRPQGWVGALQQFRTELHRYLARRLHNARNAEDLAQEVYLRLLRVENPDLVKNPQAYMYRVAANTLQEFRAREEASPLVYDSELLDQLSDKSSGDGNAAEDPIDDSELEKLVARLPPMQRTVLLMATSQDLSHAEIAKQLGISIRTVRNHLYRAIFSCRQRMTGKET